MPEKRTDGGAVSAPADMSADVSAKEIFDNPHLLAQFLRGYGGLPLLSDVRAEDIEDVTERYHLYAEVEFAADSVKKIRLHNGGKTPLYVVSLIDHKSSVDYNVCMQLLRYIVCIWSNWEKETGLRDSDAGSPMHKDFRYPPVLPIVYYEGTGKWTAGMRLRDRVFMNEVFGDYIPDFTYRLVRVRDYSAGELLARHDEMSLIMLLNRIQSAQDFDGLGGFPAEELNRIIENSPGDVVAVMAAVVARLCRKLNLSRRETDEFVHQIKGGNMGYLFENMEKMDIQEERRKTAEARRVAEETQRRLDEASRRADEATQRADEATRRADETQRKADEASRRADEAEGRLAAAQAELAALKEQLAGLQ